MMTHYGLSYGMDVQAACMRLRGMMAEQSITVWVAYVVALDACDSTPIDSAHRARVPSDYLRELEEQHARARAALAAEAARAAMRMHHARVQPGRAPRARLVCLGFRGVRHPINFKKL